MQVIGLTGNIASGKSAVAELLARRGARIVDADVLSREVVTPGSPALADIVKEWGPSVLNADGTLDRAKLRKIVFHDRSELDVLNEIVHPEVQRRRTEEIEHAREKGEKVVVNVVPLLFERQMADDFDFIVLVDAPREMRLDRIVRDRGHRRSGSDGHDRGSDARGAEARARGLGNRELGIEKDLEREVEKLWNAISQAEAEPVSASNRR